MRFLAIWCPFSGSQEYLILTQVILLIPSAGLSGFVSGGGVRRDTDHRVNNIWFSFFLETLVGDTKKCHTTASWYRTMRIRQMSLRLKNAFPSPRLLLIRTIQHDLWVP